MTDWIEDLVDDEFDNDKLNEKKRKILIAAVELMSEKNYDSVRTSEIAERAGVAEGTIFRYFKTKKDLLDAILVPTSIQFLAPKFLQEFSHDVLEKKYDSIDEFIESFIRNRFEFAMNKEPLIKIFVQQIFTNDTLRKELGELLFSAILPKTEGVLQYFKDTKQLKDYPTVTILRIIMSNLISYVILKIVFMPNHPFDDEQELQIIISNIISSIKLTNI